MAGPEGGAEAELAPLLATYPYCRPVGRRAVGEEHEKTVMLLGYKQKYVHNEARVQKDESISVCVCLGA